MSDPTDAQFRQRISSAYQQLRGISEQDSQGPAREDGWSRKEILGHLIDSALNNHQRFVRAALDGSYNGPSYQQEGWVAIHGYRTMAWDALLEHWRWQNELLSAVVERIPENRLGGQCRVGEDAPVTLRFLIEDYLAHLGHHVRQIARESV
jgi:DinB family protein